VSSADIFGPVSIWVAGTVRGKGRPRFARKTGHAYTPEQTVNYEARLSLAGKDAVGTRPLLTGPVSVSIIAYFAIPQSFSKAKRAMALSMELVPTTKPDADNIFKLAGDALNGVVWSDDKQITDATFAKRYSDQPGLAIEVRAA
jgi:Holliday junction resolvase RusA-like endonuclease